MKEEFDIENKNKIKLQINNPNIISDSFSDLNTLIIKGDY